MNRTVGEHISELESRLTLLNEKIMNNGLNLSKRNEIEAEIRAANLALAHFRSALALERELTR